MAWDHVLWQSPKIYGCVRFLCQAYGTMGTTSSGWVKCFMPHRRYRMNIRHHTPLSHMRFASSTSSSICYIRARRPVRACMCMSIAAGPGSLLRALFSLGRLLESSLLGSLLRLRGSGGAVQSVLRGIHQSSAGPISVPPIVIRGLQLAVINRHQGPSVSRQSGESHWQSRWTQSAQSSHLGQVVIKRATAHRESKDLGAPRPNVGNVTDIAHRVESASPQLAHVR